MNVSLGVVKLVCRRCWELLLGPLVWLIGLFVGTHPRVATRLLLCSQGAILYVNSRLLVPGL